MELVTCFTLCAIKSWCAAAMESVHSVCTGPVVLTGMTCTIIDTCFKGISRVNDVYFWPWRHTYPSIHFIITPDLPRLEVMTMEVQPQVCWARVTKNMSKQMDICCRLVLKFFLLKKKDNQMIAVARNSEKGSCFGFFVTVMAKDKFVVLRPLPAVVNC